MPGHRRAEATPFFERLCRVMTFPENLISSCAQSVCYLQRLGDRLLALSVLIIMMLSDGPRRFNEIKRMVGGISQRMLTLTLRGLERDGLVTRTIYPTIPPRVDYELTDLGHSLKKPVQHLGSWAFDHLPQIQSARERLDQNSAQK